MPCTRGARGVIFGMITQEHRERKTLSIRHNTSNSVIVVYLVLGGRYRSAVTCSTQGSSRVDDDG